MNQIEIFNSPEFGSIRTLEQNGKVLFCGTDVATALGYTNPRKAVRDHTRGGTKCSIGVQTGKKADGSPAVQMVEMLFIPEGDLYRLIAHSKLPSAERFEQWVFDEVLPAIRKHGAYLTKEKLWEIATSPEALIKLCSELLAEREENASLREENALLESKAAFYDLFIDLNHSTNLRTTAKELLVPERRFVRFLLEKRFVYRTASGNVLPYRSREETGCKAGKQGTFTAPDKRRTFVRHSSTRDRVRERDRDRKRERGRNGIPRPRRLWQIQQCDTDRYRAFRAENRAARQVGVLY